MGIFSRLSTLIRSNFSFLLSKAEDPEKMLVQTIQDMRAQLIRAKQEVASAIADERKLHATMIGEKRAAEEWQRRAVLAVREGRDDLAKQALLRVEEHQDRSARMEEQWNVLAHQTENLKGSLRDLNDKIEEAKRKKNLLMARQRRVEAQKRIHGTLSGMAENSAFETFERIAEQVEQTERELLASQEVQHSLKGDTLDEEFKRLEAGEEFQAEGRLIALKKELGILPANKDGETRLREGAEEEKQIREEPENADYEILPENPKQGRAR